MLKRSRSDILGCQSSEATKSGVLPKKTSISTDEMCSSPPVRRFSSVSNIMNIESYYRLFITTEIRESLKDPNTRLLLEMLKDQDNWHPWVGACCSYNIDILG